MALGFARGGEQVVRKCVGIPVRKLRVPEGGLHQTVIVFRELEGESGGGLATHDGSEVVAGGEGIVEALLFIHRAAADEAQLCTKAEIRERDHEELGTTEGFEDGASFASRTGESQASAHEEVEAVFGEVNMGQSAFQIEAAIGRSAFADIADDEFQRIGVIKPVFEGEVFLASAGAVNQAHPKAADEAPGISLELDDADVGTLHLEFLSRERGFEDDRLVIHAPDVAMKGTAVVEVYDFRRHNQRRQGQQQQRQETFQHL